jgi:hypothetical protein
MDQQTRDLLNAAINGARMAARRARQPFEGQRNDQARIANAAATQIEMAGLALAGLREQADAGPDLFENRG